MCYLPPLIHQLRFGFHPPPVSSTYQSNHFLATFQCQSHFELKAKVQLWWVRNVAKFMMNYRISDSCLSVRGWAEWEQSVHVQADTVCHTDTVWIGNDMCQEGLSALQSEVMWERRDRIRMARGGKKESKGVLSWTHFITSVQRAGAIGSIFITLYSPSNCRLISKGWLPS